MLKWSIILSLIASIIWRGTPTNCRQTTRVPSNPNINEIFVSKIRSYMDVTSRPCENFYQFACGNWYQQYIDQLEFGDTLGLVDYELNGKLEHLLRRLTISAAPSSNATTEVIATEPQPSAEEFYGNSTNVYSKVIDYFQSCKRVKPYNLKKYLVLLQPDIGLNWYVLSRNGVRSWPSDKFDWLQVIAKLRLYGLNGVLLKEEVLPRWDETTSNSIYLDKPNLAETQPMGEAPMIELMLDIGQTKRVSNAVARDVDAFERELHKLQEIEDEEGAKEMQLGYLQDIMPQIDWQSFLGTVRGPTTSLKTTVIIQNLPYMRSLVKFLNGVEKSTLCNYIMLKFLNFLKERGPAQISKIECISSLRRAMPLAMSYIVGTHFYKEPHRNDVIVGNIFKNLKRKFREILSGNRLRLPSPIVMSLVQKIDNMQLQIGYAPRNASNDFFSIYYERSPLDPHNFYANQLSLLRFAVEKDHESLEFSNEMGGYGSNATYLLPNWLGSSSSPFYVKPRNRIIVPYGFLQMPIYHRVLNANFKYTILGFTIAHEIMHGFDSNGIDYDDVGNIMGPSEEIAANQRFMQGLRCMQNELATGSRSLNEKLADYEGLRLTYETMFNGNFTHDETTSKWIPEFTNKQLFFITFAQFFCAKSHRSVRESRWMEHAVDELRVLQSLANFEEFSNEFDCEKRSKMQSRNRCRLW